MNIGSRNAYTCQQCLTTIVTVDNDEGTTPFMMACTAKPCAGMMQSHCYKGSAVTGTREPTFEWRKPTPEEYKAEGRAMRQHFDMGGLDIHPLPATPAKD